MVNLHLPSPIHEVSYKTMGDATIEFFIKREDLIHPEVSGNKWRKLIPNVSRILEGEYKGIVTFGGAFSNHIYATAAAGNLYEIPTVGIIRGEIDDQHNSTLQFAKDRGMRLYAVSRSAYREKEDNPTVQQIIDMYPNYLVVPEGGSNTDALEGCEEISNEIAMQDPSIKHIFVAAGTGTTAAGMIRSARPDQQVWVVSALKGDFLYNVIAELTQDTVANWTLLTSYHRGGYAKVDADLVAFINDFRNQTDIQLEPIYTSKTVLALIDLIKNGEIRNDERVLMVHTGGLQGIQGHNYMSRKKRRFDLVID